ncbi:MAG: hypothetical protein HRU29_16440 [Rhizobiales bacterium]|nr:hypothetical protein [Hyphomicrobiales bacterium]
MNKIHEEIKKERTEAIKEKLWTRIINNHKIKREKVPESIINGSMKYIHYKNIRKLRLYNQPKYRDPKKYAIRVLAFIGNDEEQIIDLSSEYLKKYNFMRETEMDSDVYFIPSSKALGDYLDRKKEQRIRNKWKEFGLTKENPKLLRYNLRNPEIFTNPKTQIAYPDLGYYLRERDKTYEHETKLTIEREEGLYEYMSKDYIELI